MGLVKSTIMANKLTLNQIEHYARLRAARLGLNPNAASTILRMEMGKDALQKGDAGELGPMQVMPSTLTFLEKKLGRVYDRNDPFDLTDAGLDYMAHLQNDLKIDTFPGLAKAYQGGPSMKTQGPINARYVKKASILFDSFEGSSSPQLATLNANVLDIVGKAQEAGAGAWSTLKEGLGTLLKNNRIDITKPFPNYSFAEDRIAQENRNPPMGGAAPPSRFAQAQEGLAKLAQLAQGRWNSSQAAMREQENRGKMAWLRNQPGKNVPYITPPRENSADITPTVPYAGDAPMSPPSVGAQRIEGLPWLSPGMPHPRGSQEMPGHSRLISGTTNAYQLPIEFLLDPTLFNKEFFGLRDWEGR